MTLNCLETECVGVRIKAVTIESWLVLGGVADKTTKKKSIVYDTGCEMWC